MQQEYKSLQLIYIYIWIHKAALNSDWSLKNLIFLQGFPLIIHKLISIENSNLLTKRNRSSSVFCSFIGFCLLSSCYMFQYQVPSNDTLVLILYIQCQFLKCARLITSSRKQFLIHWRQGFNPWFEYRMEECCTFSSIGPNVRVLIHGLNTEWKNAVLLVVLGQTLGF